MCTSACSLTALLLPVTTMFSVTQLMNNELENLYRNGNTIIINRDRSVYILYHLAAKFYYGDQIKKDVIGWIW
jgi:hypothetical protein